MKYIFIATIWRSQNMDDDFCENRRDGRGGNAAIYADRKTITQKY